MSTKNLCGLVATLVALSISLSFGQETSSSSRPYPPGFDPAFSPSLTEDQKNVVFLLDTLPLPFFDNMENGENGWTHTGFEHLIINPQNIQVLNPTINPRLVRLPDPGFLPVPHSGVGAWWYGENATGTFIGANFDPNQPELSGGTSVSANTGNLISPPLDLRGVGSANLSFQTWWEIEGVDADRYDLMYVEISTNGGATFFQLGKMNPLNDVNGASYVPFTNSGLGLPATWEEHVFDLSAYVGRVAILRLRFATVDQLYNGFRGWFIDDVRVTGTPVAPPSITQIIPNVGNPGSIFNINGNNFATGAAVRFNTTVIQSAVLNVNTIQCQVPSLANGAYNVTVTNPNGLSSTLPNGFTITTTPAPTIFGITPTIGLQNEAVFVTITGQNFLLGATATVGEIALTSVTVTGTQITGYTSPSLGLGSHTVRVQNQDGQYDVLVNGFTVNPLIRVIAPNGGEIVNAGSSYNISYILQATTAVKIEFSVDNGFYWTLITTTTPQGIGTQNYTWSPVPSVNSNYCLVKVSKLDNSSFNDVSNSPFSIAIGSSIPNTPGNLYVTSVGLTTVGLAWVDNSTNETGFRIYRQQGTGTWQQVATVGTNVTSFTDGGLTSNATYSYKVAAYNASGNSSYSNTVIATTGSLPSAPSNLVATVVSPSSIRLNWTDNSNNESGFKIERNISGVWTEIGTVPSNTQTYTNTGLTSGGTFSYRVRAYNQFGNSGYSNIASATTGTLPAVPGNLTATPVSTSRIDLTWIDNSTNETGFVVQGKQGSSDWAQIAPLGPNVTSFAHMNLNAGTTYYYRMYATGTIGNSSFSNIASATTGSVPVAPANLTGTVLSPSQIRLNWNRQSTNETGFRIERRTGTTGVWSVVASVGAGVLQYQDNNLSSGTTYYYRVRAFNTYGQSSASNEIALAIGSPTFSANVLVRRNGSPVSGAKVFVDRGSGFPQDEEGETNSSGLLTVSNLRAEGNYKLFATKFLRSKTATKAYHALVDNNMFELHIDSRTMQPDGSYKDYPILTQQPTYSLNLGHPIFKYNLIVCLEWTAPPDYLEKMKTGFREASRELFNATDGQVMFAKVAIYNSKQNPFWKHADIQVHEASSDQFYVDGGIGVPIEDGGTGLLFGQKMHIYQKQIGYDASNPDIKYYYSPDQSTYYKTIVHEFGHYGFGLFDEYKNGLGTQVAFKKYRNDHPLDFPPSKNYGLMDYHYDYIETSSYNDYLEEYPIWVWPGSITMQLSWGKKPCWRAIEELLEGYDPTVDITVPVYAFLRNGQAYPSNTDRPRPFERRDPSFPSTLLYNTAPDFVIASSPSSSTKSLKLNLANDHSLMGGEVYVIAKSNLRYVGRIGNVDGLTIDGLSDTDSIKIVRNARGQSRIRTVLVQDAFVDPLRLRYQIPVQSVQVDTVVPGVVFHTEVAQSSTTSLLINLYLEVDEPISSIPTIRYYTFGDTGTVIVTPIGSSRYVGTINLDPSHPDFDGTGYFAVAVTDTSNNTSQFVSYFQVYDGLANQPLNLNQRGFNAFLDRDSTDIDQTIIVNETDCLPYRTYGNTLYPVSEMFSLRSAPYMPYSSFGINISYLSYPLEPIDESSIRLYKFDQASRFWILVEGSEVDIKQKVVSGLGLDEGIYCLFATQLTNDILSPSRIDDLVAFPGEGFGTVKLLWTAPGNDSTYGRAAYYEIRTLEHAITVANWDSARPLLNGRQPSYFGDPEEASSRFDDVTTTYFFGIKTVDDAGNVSLLSNVASSQPSSLSPHTTSITIRNSRFSRSVFFGRNENATDGYDIGLDLLWSHPDSGFHAYFLSADQTKLMADMRRLNITSLQWSLHVDSTMGTTDTIVVSWDVTSIPEDGEYRINGLDMKSSNSIFVVGNSTLGITFTRFFAPLVAPSLLAPPTGAELQPVTLTLSWDPVLEADTYYLQVATDSLFGTMVFQDSAIATTTRQIGPLANNARYHWRVRAKNVGGTGPYSESWRFTTIVAAPVAPLLASPTNNAINQPITLAIKWRSVATLTEATSDGAQDRLKAERSLSAETSGDDKNSPEDKRSEQFLASVLVDTIRYHLQVATDSLFTSLVVNDSTLVDTSRQVGPLANNTRYYWRVRGKSIGGTGPYSESWRFTTIVAAPIAPLLFSPANGSVGNQTSLTLLWRSSLTTTNYRVQVATDSVFTSLIVNDSTLTDTTRLVANLQPLTTYYWRASATNIGGTSAYSARWNFRTMGVPTTVSLLSPPNNAINQPIAVTFRWQRAFDQTLSAQPIIPAVSDKAPSVTTGMGDTDEPLTVSAYWHEMVTDTLTMAQLQRDTTLTDTTITISGLANAATYYWRVKAKNQLGWGSFNPWWKITTIVAAPSAPLLVSPVNNAILQPITLTIRWHSTATLAESSSDGAQERLKTERSISAGAGDDVKNVSGDKRSEQEFSSSVLVDTIRYHLQVATDTVFTNLIVNDSALTDTTRLVANLQPLTTYYWRVSATNIGGTGAYSARWNFRTMGVPTTVSLVSPPNNAVNQPTSITFSWQRAADQTLILQPSGGGKEHVEAFRKRADLLDGASQDAEAESKPAIVETDEKDELFTVSAYWFELAIDTTGLLVVRDTSLTDTTRSVNSLSHLTAYYWRVRARNELGWGQFSPWWKFTTTITAPLAPILAFPPNNASNQPTTLTLGWHPAATAETYHLQLATDSTFAIGMILSDSLVVDTSRTADSLSNSSRYFWRVRAKNLGGVSVYSDVWSFTTALTGVTEADGLPREFALKQNYPNPFNPSTTIQYEVPTAVHVVLKVYNLLGQEMETLVDEIKQPGRFAKTWDSQNVPSGIYFYRMQAGRFSGTKKLLLIK